MSGAMSAIGSSRAASDPAARRNDATTGRHQRWSHDQRARGVAAFVVIAGIAGTLYAATVPPLQVADEKTHLFRAFGVSRGSCIAGPRTSVPNSLLRLNAAFPPLLEKRRLVTADDVRGWARLPLHPERASKVRADAANVYG